MYKIIGGDKKEYGPVSREQLLQWIAEGRVNAQTQICAEGSSNWLPLAAFPEFANVAGSRAGGSTAPSPVPSVPFGVPNPKRNPMALTGLILGIASLLCCGPFFSIPGIIFSIVGLVQIKKNPLQYSGRGLAIAGLVLSIVSLVITVVLIAFYGIAGIAGMMEEMKKTSGQ